ncbi:MAG: PHP domain-containing protein [Geminicoccaceae bacterium]
MPHAPFVHLRVRTSYSLLEGAIDHKALAARAAASGMPAVAVTDNANLYGVMSFCSATLAAGVQPIIGALLPLALAEGQRSFRRERQHSPALLPVLAQNAAGYGSLMKLMSTLHFEAGSDKGLTPDVAGTAERRPDRPDGRRRRAARPAAAARQDAALVLLDHLAEAFAGRLYVELQHHGESPRR